MGYSLFPGMEEEGNDSRIRRMDVNLYLGLPHSPRPRRPDLGSDLSLNSLPMPAVDDRQPLVEMPVMSELSDPHPPYSPSHSAYSPTLPAMNVNPTPSPEYTPYFPSYEPYNNSSYAPIQLPIVNEIDESNADEPIAIDGSSHMPYSPPYVPPTSTYSPHYAPPPTTPDEVAFSFYPAPHIHAGEFLGENSGSSSRNELHRSPELRFRRLIESSHRSRSRRFRSSVSFAGERSSFGSPSTPTEQLIMNVSSPQGSVECTRKDKVSVESIAVEASEEEAEEKNRSAANFECNICLDMATEPVVTSCGHLFCWPCLYQWLHVHSDHNECPVCKGEVTESNITPIYGRGSSENSAEKKFKGEGESGLKIPPRPRGNRVESLRQQFRPISRRLGEGIASSWRRLLDHQMRYGSGRLEGQADPALQEILDGAHRRAITRLRARTLLREEVNRNSGSISGSVNGDIGLPPGNSALNPVGSTSSSLFRDGIDLWQRFSLYGIANTERLAAITADLGRVVGQFASISNRYGASTSSANPPNSEPPAAAHDVGAALGADQVSASSTMATIQGEVTISDNPSEPNSAGSSRAHRRRGRSGTSGSLDVDGGALHACKRRRLN